MNMSLALKSLVNNGDTKLFIMVTALIGQL